jgi:hypothetical protein
VPTCGGCVTCPPGVLGGTLGAPQHTAVLGAPQLEGDGGGGCGGLGFEIGAATAFLMLHREFIVVLLECVVLLFKG